MKSDIEIAREASMKPIKEIADSLGIPEEMTEPYGKFIAKVPYSLIDEEKASRSRLILVTAITPTKAGIGKTTVSVGLALGMAKTGRNGRFGPPWMKAGVFSVVWTRFGFRASIRSTVIAEPTPMSLT